MALLRVLPRVDDVATRRIGLDPLPCPRHLTFGPALEHARTMRADFRIADDLFDAGQKRVDRSALRILVARSRPDVAPLVATLAQAEYLVEEARRLVLRQDQVEQRGGERYRDDSQVTCCAEQQFHLKQ